MPLILGGGDPTSQYLISNSMRFDRGATTCLRKTFSGSPTNAKKFTMSCWIKLANPEDTNAKAIFSGIKSGVNEDVIKFGSINNDHLNYLELNFNNTNDGALMGGDGSVLEPLFRDPTAWFHLVVAGDSTQGTADNRLKAYVNGVQFALESSISGGNIQADTDISSNYDFGFLTASAHSIGENVESAGNEPFDGYISEFYFIDGQQLTPTSFAEENDDGVWIPKDAKDDLTFGNYGFFLEFKGTGTSADSSGKGADTSGNDNHFDDNGAGTDHIVTDTPTNNFCVLNPIAYRGSIKPNTQFTQGNLGIQTTSTFGADSDSYGTFGVKRGKWYYECQYTGGNVNIGVGWSSADFSDRVAYYGGNGYKYHEGGSAAYGATFSSGDIIGVAMNLDDREITFYKNGADQGTIDDLIASNDQFYLPAIWDGSGSLQATYNANFGNPLITHSSSQSDEAGFGDFEYAPPSGYFALCSQNIATKG